MPSQEYPTLNGIAPSWADIKIAIAALGANGLLETADFNSISFASSVEIGTQRGASGGRVMKRTRGSKSDEAELGMYKSGARSLVELLASVAPERDGGLKQVGLAHFNINVQWSPPGDSSIWKLDILGCRITGMTFASSDGSADPDVVPIPLSVIDIVQTMPDGTKAVLL